MIVLLLLVVGSFGVSHGQDWNCLGPQPSPRGACGAPMPQAAAQALRIEQVRSEARPFVTDGHPQGVGELVRRRLGEQ